jgi:hypothetical protein
MVIGLAYLVSDGGEVSAMDRGAVVRVGDRIETSANGHVHLRFADGPDEVHHMVVGRHELGMHG